MKDRFICLPGSERDTVYDRRGVNSLIIHTLRIVQVIREDEGTAGGRSDSAAENNNFLFLFYFICLHLPQEITLFKIAFCPACFAGLEHQ
jgi:hypothetical protein